MIAQIYEDGMVRVFDRKGSILCDVYATSQKATGEADAALKRIRMRRTGKWRRWPYHIEASVRFESPRKVKPSQ